MYPVVVYFCMCGGMYVAHFKVGHEAFRKFEVKCMYGALSWISVSPDPWLWMRMVQRKYWCGDRL